VVSLVLVIFKTKPFFKWQKRTNLSDSDLMVVIENLKSGLSTVKLGKNLYKVRVTSSNKGKRGSYRTLIIFKKDNIAVFSYSFKKSEKDNLDKTELVFWKIFAQTIVNFTELELENALKKGELIKVKEN